jgi:hypothetical protein
LFDHYDAVSMGPGSSAIQAQGIFLGCFVFKNFLFISLKGPWLILLTFDLTAARISSDQIPDKLMFTLMGFKNLYLGKLCSNFPLILEGENFYLVLCNYLH